MIAAIIVLALLAALVATDGGSNPADYRDFFTALAKSLFLEAQDVG